MALFHFLVIISNGTYDPVAKAKFILFICEFNIETNRERQRKIIEKARVRE